MATHSELRCCICGDPAPEGSVLGQRPYCARHLTSVNKPHPGFWRSALVQLLLMGALALVGALVGGALGPIGGIGVWIVGLLLALVPSALWLWFFYRNDKLEPEPKTLVLGVALLAAGLYELIGRPLVVNVFRMDEWANRESWVSLLANVLIMGTVTQGVAYLAMRTVTATSEFDERMDGIVYGTAAGLGVAAMMNLRYVIDAGGVALAPGIVRTVTTALALAGFSGLMGWFIAEAKFTHKPLWFVPLGFALVLVLNGVFTWLIREASAVGLTVDPLRSLGLGIVVAIGTFLLIVALMRRAVSVTLSKG
jgi:protease PrsW